MQKIGIEKKSHIGMYMHVCTYMCDLCILNYVHMHVDAYYHITLYRRGKK